MLWAKEQGCIFTQNCSDCYETILTNLKKTCVYSKRSDMNPIQQSSSTSSIIESILGICCQGHNCSLYIWVQIVTSVVRIPRNREAFLSEDERVIRYACGCIGMKLHEIFERQHRGKAASVFTRIEKIPATGPILTSIGVHTGMDIQG